MTTIRWVLRWLVLASVLVAPGLEAAGLGNKAAAGRPFNIALNQSDRILTGTVAVVGTQDLGDGLDGVIIRCQLYDGATQQSSLVGSPSSAAVPVGSQLDIPLSCDYSPAQAVTLGTVPGSYLYVTVEQAGNPGKLIASSGTFRVGQPATQPARFTLPSLVIVGVTKQGSSFVVAGRYVVTAVGVTSPPYTADFGWFTTGSPSGNAMSLGSFTLNQTASDPDSVFYTANFTATFDTASAPGLAGAVALYVSLPGAPTVVANASFPTALTCNASAMPQVVAPGQNVTLTASCQNNVGPLQVDWKDAAGTVVGTGAILNFVPTGTGSKQYTASVTDQVSTNISQQGIILTTAPVNVTVAAAPSGCSIAAVPPSLPFAGGQVTLTASCTGGDPATGYTWTGPGVEGQTTAAVTTNITATSTFTVVAANAGGASSPASSTVTVAAATAPSGCSIAAAPPSSPAGGGQVTLTASCTGGDPATGYTWTGPGVASQTTAVVVTTITATSTFTVVAANAGGGSSPASRTVTVAAAAPSSCSIAGPTSLPSGGGQITLTAACTEGDPATGYTWTGPGVASQTTAVVVTSITATSIFTVVAANAGGSSSPASLTVTVAPPPAAGISSQSGNPPPSNPGSRVPLAVKVVDAQGNPVATAQFATTVTGGNGTLTLLTPQPADGVYLFDFLLGSDTSTRTVKICLANATSTCSTFSVGTIETSIIVPAQQLIGPQAATALSTPTIQLKNVRQHLDHARARRSQAVTQALRVSVDGRALPSLDAFALAPVGQDGRPATDRGDGRPATGGGASADAVKTGGGAAADKAADPFARWGAFINGDIDIGKQSAVGTQTGFKLTSKGLTLGTDYRFQGEHVLGAALGLLKADTDLNDSLGSQDAKGYSLSLFGSYVPTENAYIDLIANLGHNSYDSQRQQMAGGQATSNTSGNQFAIALNAGWNFARGPLTANPFGRVEYVDAKVNGFTESGNPDEALTVSEQRLKATTLTLGGQASYAISASWGVLLPYARLEFQYLAQSNAQNVTAQLAGVTAPGVIVPTLGQDKTFGNYSLGASAILPQGVSAFFDYQQLFGKDNFKDQKYTLGLRMEF